MANRIIAIIFHVFIFQQSHPSRAKTWVKVGYWYYGNDFPVSNINSALYTHLICAFANLDPSSFELSIPSDDNGSFSVFTNTVKQKNAEITALLSIGGDRLNYSTISLMVSNSSYRKAFINSSINLARHYGFQGLDLSWGSANTSENMANMGTLFEEWRAAIASEAINSSSPELLLTAAVSYSPWLESIIFPIDSIKRNLNWVHVMAIDYFVPTWFNFTGAHAALYNPNSDINTDFGIEAWISGGLSENKLVLCLPFYGYAWTLANPNQNYIGAPATGPAVPDGGAMSYKDIKEYVQQYGGQILYNATYVMNYYVNGLTWIGFDDVEAIKTKVSYAKEKGLLGYTVWQVPQDDNWALSQAAAEIGNDKQPKWQLLVIILSTTVAVILLAGLILYLVLRRRKLGSKGIPDRIKESKLGPSNVTAAGDFNSNVPNLVVYNLADIEKATNKFSFENKLGQGGYGPVYKGVLPDGLEIAVKKLSKTSAQGFEEFKNEVMLTAKLQHINLVRVLGFCIDQEEKMLIYEYMPNKSLDHFLFDPLRRYLLDWRKRLEIIDGITQGLLYLQEYSRLTIIHRDLKASNILLDDGMKPKISDFGMARIFTKDEQEANTRHIVGTYGYVPPEYVKQGIYSTKSDVYSFGVLLLEIISGKRNACFYGVEENLSLLEHAYVLWKDGKGMEFMDSTLDDTFSSCKLMTCMQIALLCVQENPGDRPSMLDVWSMLKNETAVVGIPNKPAFSTKRDGEEEAKPLLQAVETHSVNDVTISQLVGR